MVLSSNSQHSFFLVKGIHVQAFGARLDEGSSCLEHIHQGIWHWCSLRECN